jgi:beta-glucosidase
MPFFHMTRQKKQLAAQLSGLDYWHTKPNAHVPSLLLCDGPAGLRIQPGKADYFGKHPSLPANLYPSPAAMANTWNEQLVQDAMCEIAKEGASLGADMLLGPGINLKRSPLGGRNFEYYSEDPLLSGRLGKAAIQGIHAGGMAACLKHYAMNSQERFRMTSDSIADEETVDFYLEPFRIAIQARPKAVMTAYNKINGIYCAENKALMDKARSWGFDGIFISDWGGVHDPAKSVAAGLNLEMPPSPDFADIVAKLPEQLLNERIRPFAKLKKAKKSGYDPIQGRKMAYQAALESIVLAKTDGSLPLTGKIALIGWHAKHPLVQGQGSAKVNPRHVVSLYEALKPCGILYAQGWNEDGTTNEKLLEGAKFVCESADHVVLCAGLLPEDVSEGYDRPHLRLPEGINQVIQSLAEFDVTVLLQVPGPVEMPWYDDIRNLLICQLAGMEEGQAAADILLGRANPSGRLAETWPLKLEDGPVPCLESRNALYQEGCQIGYRWYESRNIPVRFPFGFGLSYGHVGWKIGEQNGHICVELKNDSDMPALEVVQLYISGRHCLELADFAKVSIPAHSKKTCTFPIPAGIYGIGRNIRSILWYNDERLFDRRPQPLLNLPNPSIPAYGLDLTLHDLKKHGCIRRLLVFLPWRQARRLEEMPVKLLVMKGVPRRLLQRISERIEPCVQK